MWVGQPRIHETDYYVYNIAMRLREAAQPTNTQASATRATPTQPGFAQPHNSPRPAFSTACRLPTGTQRAARPTRRQQPQLARAPRVHDVGWCSARSTRLCKNCALLVSVKLLVRGARATPLQKFLQIATVDLLQTVRPIPELFPGLSSVVRGGSQHALEVCRRVLHPPPRTKV